MGRYAYRVETLGPYRIDPLLHWGLAVKVARQFLRPGLDLDDLVQEALTALCVAARNYDDSKGASVATWAVSLMTNHLKGVVRSDTRMGSFGGRGANTIYPNALRRYIRGGGKDLSVAGLREMFKDVPHSSALTDYDLGILVNHTLYPDLSLDVPVHESGDNPGSITMLIDTIVDESADEEHSEQEYNLDLERVLSQLDVSNPRERDILMTRTLSREPDTLEDVAARWGLSRERVRQIEARLIHRIVAKLNGVVVPDQMSKESSRNVLMMKSKILKGQP